MIQWQPTNAMKATVSVEVQQESAIQVPTTLTLRVPGVEVPQPVKVSPLMIEVCVPTGAHVV